MRPLLLTLASTLFLVAFTGWTTPDDRIVAFSECTINEGKTMTEVEAANSAWVKFMNANVEGGDIQSYILSSKVGEREPRGFMFVDSYPSLASWAAGDVALGSDAGKALQADHNGLMECSKNELHKSKQSE
ncbi:MAG: hypothetical protein ACI9W4_002332 [Rhodothermales bacterium]|jgi:hypothetical protein